MGKPPWSDSALSQPLVVAVRDAQGQPVAGLSVTFQVVQGQGTVSPAQAPTGQMGRRRPP